MTLVVWTDDRITELRQLWANGYTCSQAAAALGGITRNAVIGKVRRLGLEGRASGNASLRKFHPRTPKAPSDRAPRKRYPSAPQPRPNLAPEEIELRVAAVIPLHVTLMDLERHQCRYPYGDQAFTFCGHPQFGESSYCSAHMLLCTGRGTASERNAVRVSPVVDTDMVIS